MRDDRIGSGAVGSLALLLMPSRTFNSHPPNADQALVAPGVLPPDQKSWTIAVLEVQRILDVAGNTHSTLFENILEHHRGRLVLVLPLPMRCPRRLTRD